MTDVSAPDETVAGEFSARETTRGPKLRADLISRNIDMGRDPMVVCKDPLSRAYHHFTQSEYELLCLADGRRSSEEIAIEMKRRYPPALIQTVAVERFFQQAMQQGLLESPSIEHNSVARKTSLPKKKWNWLSLLAVRFPGFNPTSILETLAPIANFMFSRPVAMVSMIAAPVCLLSVLVQFDRFAFDFSTVTQHPMNSLIGIALGIAIAKVFHELAHALACRHLGCECPSIGVMLLCGIPYLYADVSDAWMLKRRQDRMLISAAGMYAECWIAMLATLVWLMSHPGPAHDLAVTLMVVCSASTLLINGNPLLRYDGYYLLSDFTGTANLASRSRASLAARVQTVLGKPATTSEPIWMAVYAFASGIYRCVVLFSIAAVIFRALQVYDLDLVGILLFTTVFLVTLIKNLSSIHHRPTGRLVVAAVIMIAAIAFPIPRSVVAPMIVVPANPQEIYVSEPGFLIHQTAFGQRIESNGSISELKNPELDRRHAVALANRNRIESQLQTLQRSRGDQSQTGNMIPSLQKDLEQAAAMVRLNSQSLDRLNITSAKAGTLYPPTNLPQPSVKSFNQFRNDTGTWLAEGTPIGMLGDDHRREAVLYLPDRQVAKIQLGQSVSLMISDAAKGSVGGRVVSIDASPCDQFPPSMLETGLVSALHENVYRVRVQLDASGDHLVVHRIGRAKINTTSESIAQRIYRLLSETFG